MGMTAGLVRASTAELQRLRANPAEAPAFVDGDEWAPPVRRVQPKGILGLLLRLTPITIEEVDPDAVPPDAATEDDARPHVDLDKAWQPLHYLLTGTAWEGEEPACYLVRGGEELCEDEKSGYSSIRLLTPEAVRRFDDWLRGLTHDALRQRFDHDAMVALRIYSKPRGSKGPPARPDVEPLLEAFDDLRRFVADTAGTGDGIVVYLT